MSRFIAPLTGRRRYGGRWIDKAAFGTWTGTNNSAQLVDQYGNPINAGQPVAIWRSDWQGRQLLYPTARTNYAPPASSFTLNNSGNTLTTGVADPQGGTGAITVSGMGTTSPYSGLNMATFAAEQLGNVQVGIWALGNGSVTIEDQANNYSQTLNLTATWTLYQINATIGVSLQYAIRALINPGDTATSMSLYAPMFVPGAILGSYIPTNGAPVTLTDYTLAGTTVNLAQAPASTAKTTWSGYAT